MKKIITQKKKLMLEIGKSSILKNKRTQIIKKISLNCLKPELNCIDTIKIQSNGKKEVLETFLLLEMKMTKESE